MNPQNGTNGPPSPCDDVRDESRAGWPTGREPSGHGVPRVLVGVTSHQGARESRAQGDVAQVTGWPGAVRYAKCGTPKQH